MPYPTLGPEVAPLKAPWKDPKVRWIQGCVLALLALSPLLLTACAGSPTQPGGPPSDPAPDPPPPNAPPVIVSIQAQGARPKQPPGFADLGDEIAVSASVTDAETPPGQLEYQWSASEGSFTGSGPGVTWRAPASAETPLTVTLTLRVVERYGPAGSLRHEVTGTHEVALHDSAKELGDMARRFLTEFSKPQTNKDWRDVMRDFSAERCPDPRQVHDERDQVVRHYTHFVMHDYSIGPAGVTIGFGGLCPFRSRPGDACVRVPVFWDSTDGRDGRRAQTVGVDHLAGAYSVADVRWWLCSSDLGGVNTFGHAFYSSN